MFQLPSRLSVIDIVYGGSIFNLFWWVIFGLLGQVVVGILILDRRRKFVETCYGLVRAQYLVAALIVSSGLICAWSCHSRSALLQAVVTLVLIQLMTWLYFGAFFVIVVPTISWLYHRPPVLSSLSLISLIAVVVDSGLVIVHYLLRYLLQ